MYNGNAIEAGRASQLTGLPLHRIIILIKAGRIFGTRIRDRWMISPASLPELRAIAKRERNVDGPCTRPGFFKHREGNKPMNTKNSGGRPLQRIGQKGGVR